MERDDDSPGTGHLDGVEHRFPVRVYFEDTDASGVVYHANYLRYIERARTEMLRLAGIDHRASVDAGMGAYAVAAVHIRFVVPARLDDVLLVVSRLSRLRAASVLVHQQVRRGAQMVADAAITLALVAPSGRPRRHPAAWTAILHPFIAPEESVCTPS